MAFKITKENSSNIWKHSDTNDSSFDLILSIGYFRMDGNTFELFKESGGRVRVAELSDIIVQDVSSGGGEETFSNALELVTRLKALEYPYFA